MGAKERVEEIAGDLVEHYETRTSVLEDRATVVAMSREKGEGQLRLTGI